jgi:hypothetical protein
LVARKKYAFAYTMPKLKLSECQHATEVKFLFRVYLFFSLTQAQPGKPGFFCIPLLSLTPNAYHGLFIATVEGLCF